MSPNRATASGKSNFFSPLAAIRSMAIIACWVALDAIAEEPTPFWGSSKRRPFRLPGKQRPELLRNGPAISCRFEAQSGAAEPWARRGDAERWLGLVPSPPTEHSSPKVSKQEMSHG